eukprot:CAMPEP_0174734080 /NCGR_PEP_ID=MMETSP1094-20130205/62574_1 /TAXON_ID=156173 /ORGANISM="Chrysochromulina brevifilum, Strain UTEX LB 985" /LENGTH=65 /DNA_ID=CAMNT_0015936835 /DNA_START=123 /DNA_END=320 /DNA_ORIENTATION=-
MTENCLQPCAGVPNKWLEPVPHCACGRLCYVQTKKLAHVRHASATTSATMWGSDEGSCQVLAQKH